MKRYFDIAKDKITLEVSVNDISSEYSVYHMEGVLGFGGLREIGEQEFNNLKAEYTGVEEDLDGQVSFLD